MVKVGLCGQMANSMKESLLMMKDTDKEFSNGKMVENTMDNGVMENNMG
jgi:hypothetical protein